MVHPASQFYDAVVDSKYPGKDGDTYSTRWPGKVTRIYHTAQAAVDATQPGGHIYVGPEIVVEAIRLDEEPGC